MSEESEQRHREKQREQRADFRVLRLACNAIARDPNGRSAAFPMFARCDARLVVVVVAATPVMAVVADVQSA